MTTVITTATPSIELQRLSGDVANVIVNRQQTKDIEVSLSRPRSPETSLDHESEGGGDDEEWDFPESGRQAWTVVLGSFFGLVAIFGTINSVGAVQAYISTNQLADLSDAKVSWIFSIFLFLSTLLGLQVGPIFDLYGPYTLCIAGTAMFVGCLVLTSFCQTYVQFLLAFGIGAGSSIALLMTPLFAVVGHWFNKKRGTAIGVATMGGSLGGVIFPIILRKLYSSLGFGWAIRILALICLVSLALSIFLIKPRFPPRPQEGDHDNPRGNLKFIAHHYMEMIRELKSLKDPRFFFLILANFLGESAVLNGLTYLTSYAVAQGNSQNFSYALLAILNSCGIIGRIVPGYLADRLGRFNTLIGTVTFAWLTIFSIWLPFGHKSVGLIMFCVFHGFSNGGIMILGSVCVGQICRTKDFGKRYGIMYFFTSFGFLVGIPISGALIKGNDYTNLVIFSGSLYLASMISLLIARYYCVGLRVCKV